MSRKRTHAPQVRTRDLPALLGTPLGRKRLRRGALRRAWPALALLARIHRATLARRVRVVAVVGSVGKTTTTRMIGAALGEGTRVALGANSASNLALGILKLAPWTERAVIEVGISAPGEMRAYARFVRPDVVVMTAIGSEHHRALGGVEGIQREKAEMLRALRPSGRALLNADDPRVVEMAGASAAPVATFGMTTGADVRARDVTLDWPHGMRMTVEAGATPVDVATRLVGRHQALAVAAATAVAVHEGIDPQRASSRLEAVPPVPGRLEPVPLAHGAWALRDDHKSAIETFDAALDVLAEIPATRRIAVVGRIADPPEGQGPAHRHLGARLAGIADRVVVVDGDPQPYATGARRAGAPPELRVDGAPRVQDAVALLAPDLRPGDVLLIKGRHSQKLARIPLALAGREVRCELKSCDIKLQCQWCPMLGRGWPGGRVSV